MFGSNKTKEVEITNKTNPVDRVVDLINTFFPDQKLDDILKKEINTIMLKQGSAKPFDILVLHEYGHRVKIKFLCVFDERQQPNFLIYSTPYDQFGATVQTMNDEVCAKRLFDCYQDYVFSYDELQKVFLKVDEKRKLYEFKASEKKRIESLAS